MSRRVQGILGCVALSVCVQALAQEASDGGLSYDYDNPMNVALRARHREFEESCNNPSNLQAQVEHFWKSFQRAVPVCTARQLARKRVDMKGAFALMSKALRPVLRARESEDGEIRVRYSGEVQFKARVQGMLDPTGACAGDHCYLNTWAMVEKRDGIALRMLYLKESSSKVFPLPSKEPIWQCVADRVSEKNVGVIVEGHLKENGNETIESLTSSGLWELYFDVTSVCLIP